MATAMGSMPGMDRNAQGCWTCKLRRKKCDGGFPTCHNCATLHIDCHQSQSRPVWMDGGVKQEHMAEEVKCKVKENAHRRRGEHSVNIFSAQNTTGEAIQDSYLVPQTQLLAEIIPSAKHLAASTTPESECRPSAPSCASTGIKQLSKADSLLIAFYMENLFPFLFPFHQPSGGRSWMLELMLSSLVVRQATLCQSSYYIALSSETADDQGAWEIVLSQTRDAFGVLGQSLSIINGEGIAQHTHGAVRILTCITQLQRFEVALSSFTNCAVHLNAAVALFRQLLESGSGETVQISCARSSFDAVLSRLGPASWTLLNQDIVVPSAEQAAFRFSSALVVLEDIIASTVLQEPPKLYEHHTSLLVNNFDSSGPTVDLKAAMGCENWVLLQIGEIAALDAWKQTCKRAGTLDMMALVQRATSIKNTLETNLAWADAHQSTSDPQDLHPLSVLHVFRAHKLRYSPNHHSPVTRVWTHAALAYLSVVVSGWQPASIDVQHHVQQVLNLLLQLSSPALLRTMVWPFCVAGCLAETSQESQFRGLAQTCQPLNLFGTVHKALEIMEKSWQGRSSVTTDRDLATCFRRDGQLVLLI